MTCQHPALAPRGADRVCLDCGETILPTGEAQPSMFPDESKAEALRLANLAPARQARAILQRSLF